MFTLFFLSCLGSKPVPMVTPDQFEELRAQVSAQNDRIAEQQKAIEAQQEAISSLNEKMAERTPANRHRANDEEAERAASELYRTIAMSANKILSPEEIQVIKITIEQMKTQYENTRASRRISSLARELEVLGKSVPSKWDVEKLHKRWKYNPKKVTLLVFWELWCPHCKREIPNLDATYDKYKAKGLDVVGFTKLTRSSSKEKTLNFLKEENVGYPTVQEGGDISSHFNVAGIPAAALVKDGKVIWRGHPARLSDEMLDSVLN